MRADEPNVHDLVIIIDLHDHPESIAAHIKNHTVVSQKACGLVDAFDIRII